MAIAHTVTGTIVEAHRIRITRNGNPRVLVTVKDDFGGQFDIKTEPDSSYVNDVLNETRDGSMDAADAHTDRRYRFHINGRGNLGKLERLGQGE